MSNIKVAVIGAGMMGKNHLKMYKTLPNVDLVGVYDVFSDSAAILAGFFYSGKPFPAFLRNS